MNIISPDIYNNLDLLPPILFGWNSDNSIFCELIETYRPKHIIEVGTWLGCSAFTMAKCCDDFGLRNTCKITCVDTWLGALEFWTMLHETPERNLMQKNGYPQVYYQFLSNVVHHGYQDIILPFPTTSLIAARFFSQNNVSADLVYIDGSHDYEDILADMNAYWPITNHVMFGDDYSWVDVSGRSIKMAVKMAVDEFSKSKNINCEIVGDTWMFKKTKQFNETYYLENYEDVANAVKNNQFTSGFDHWLKHGRKEKRRAHYQCRYDIINHLISKMGYKNYLEIGVADCSNFNRINLESKTGVDIQSCPCPILIMSSDKFFELNNKFFDIIFIDGLHKEAQVDKDIKNSLKFLNPNGIIVLHDCLPPNEWHAREENDCGSWNGTTWKSVLKYFNDSNYNCYIVDTDWGCGVIDTSKTKLNTKCTALPEILTFDPWANYLKTNYAISEKEFFDRV